jgi:hypothetical protein
MPTWLSATNTDQVPIDVVDNPNNPTNYHPVDNPAFETQINPALNWHLIDKCYMSKVIGCIESHMFVQVVGPSNLATPTSLT